MIEFTEAELRKTKIKLFQQGVDKSSLAPTELPQDLLLIEYEIGETLYCDAVRSATQVAAFDVFYDKVSAAGGKILSITNMIGLIPPKLYQG